MNSLKKITKQTQTQTNKKPRAGEFIRISRMCFTFSQVLVN